MALGNPTNTAWSQTRDDTLRFCDYFGLAVAAWVTLLAWLTPNAPPRPLILWGVVGIVVVYAVVAPVTLARTNRGLWAAGWLVVSVLAECAGPLAGTAGWSIAAGTGFLPLVAAGASGRVRTSSIAIGVLVAAVFLRPVINDAWSVGAAAITALMYLVAGVALHYAFQLIQGGVAERQRLRDDLAVAATARAVADERAEAAARLHDTVLQHLVSIAQADSLEEARRRAARTSADLRRFLRGNSSGTSTRETLEAAVAEAAAGVDVRFSCAGDAAVGERTVALVDATAEAVRNATRHGRPPVTVFAEIDRDAAQVFIADRGDGFDPDVVPADRMGVRGSIRRRLDRVDGTARLTCTPGRTEWSLSVPVGQQEVRADGEIA